MKITFHSAYLKKRFPLRISRGLIEGAHNLFVCIEKDGIEGWGEMSPGKSEGATTVDEAQKSLQSFIDTGIDKLGIYEIFDTAVKSKVPLCALAALDIALWDLKAKQANMPLYSHLGLPKPTVATSVTLGIMSPEEVSTRIPILLDNTGVKSLKVKLGSTDGIEADKSMFAQVVDETKSYDINLRVDANGGWSVNDANEMIPWLATKGVDYVEQPLKEGQEDDLKHIFKNRALPIFVDESCRVSANIPKWAEYVDGVNMKLMKCGGITEALRIIATARAHGLKTMIGCMGESSISISAGVSISGIIDYIDLDSHLNLDPDPCTGAVLTDGIMMPNDLAGHGASFINKPTTHV